MSDDYAIITTGGKQYRVREGDTVQVEKLPGDVGASIDFDSVLLTSVGGKVAIGTPAVKGASVTGEISAQALGPKLISLRYKNKTRQRTKTGHRQPFTAIVIKQIKAK